MAIDAVSRVPGTWRAYLMLTLSVAIVGLGLGVLPPLTALVLYARGYGSGVVGLQAACPAVGSVIGALLASRLSHLMSVRTSLVLAILLAAISTIPNDFSANLYLWAGLRLLFGIAMGLLFTASEAEVNELVGDAARGRLIALYTTTFTVFQLLGPALVALMRQQLSWPFSAAGAVFLLPLPLLMLMHTDASPPRQEKGEQWRKVWPRMRVIVRGTAFFAAFDVLALALLPLYGLRHGLSSASAVLSATVVLIGDATLQLALGWLADRIGRARVHVLSGVLTVLLLVSLPLVVGTGAWWLALYLLGGAAGGIYTLAMVACGERFSGGELVAASGMVSATWGVASCVAPLLAGVLMQFWSPEALIGTLLIAVLWFLQGVWQESAHGD